MNNTMQRKSRITLIVFAVITFLFLALCVAVSNIGTVAVFLTSAVFLIILFGRYKKGSFKPCFVCSIIFTCVLAFTALIWLVLLLLPTHSYLKYQYPFDMKYISLHSLSKNTPDFFPERIPSNASDYEFDFLPTILQGQGHLTVGFSADDEYIDELKSSLEGQAKYIVPIEEFSSLNERIRNEEPDDPLRGIELYWGDCLNEHSNGTLYIIDTNYYTHHPHTKAVIVDENYVFFSDY